MGLLTIFFTAGLILRLQVKSKTKELRIKNEELVKEIKYRRQAEEALRQSEANLREAQTVAHIGSWTLDMSNNLLQTIEFHTSGSQPLAIGDDFGAIELVGFVGELIKEGSHLLFERLPIIAEGMKVKNLLLEPSPQFLDGVVPGSIGGQAKDLDGQVVVDGLAFG